MYLLSYTSVAQFGDTGKTLYDKYLFQSECFFNFVCESIRDINNGGSKPAYKSEYVHAINVFHDVNST